MNILLLNGSPREKGNTSILLDAIDQGIVQSGQVAERISLPHLNIHPCTGCGHCEQTGECIFDDDMQELYLKIANAQRIVIGSPIYFYSITAQAKAFIDRCQVFYSRKYLLGQTSDDRTNKKGYFVSVGATGGYKLFDGVQLTIRYAYDAMDFTYNGGILVKGADNEGAINEQKEKLAQAAELGRQLCEE